MSFPSASVDGHVASDLAFPKEKTPRDAKYLAWIRTLNCAFCGNPPPNEASHHGKRGMGIKASDYEALPACRRCHQRHHDCGSPLPEYDELSREERADIYKGVAEGLRKVYIDRVADHG